MVFHKEQCTGCGKCQEACLIGAIALGKEGKPIKCMHCGACVAFCPARSARAGGGALPDAAKVLYIDLSRKEMLGGREAGALREVDGGHRCWDKAAQGGMSAGNRSSFAPGADNLLHRSPQRHISRGHQDRGHLQVSSDTESWASPMPVGGFTWP